MPNLDPTAIEHGLFWFLGIFLVVVIGGHLLISGISSRRAAAKEKALIDSEINRINGEVKSTNPMSTDQIEADLANHTYSGESLGSETDAVLRKAGGSEPAPATNSGIGG